MNAQDVVTVSHVVRESWLKQDGTCFVRLRITFKRQSKFLKTSILLHAADIKISRNKKPNGEVEIKYSIKNPDLRYQAEQLVHDMEEKVSTIGTFALQGMTIDQVVSHLQKEMTEDQDNFRLDFFAFADEVIEAKKGQSKKTYQSVLNSFKAYVGKPAMDISELTSTTSSHVYLYAIQILLGFSFAFHVCCWAKQIRLHQTDITGPGKVRSLLVITIFIILFTCVIVLTPSSGVSNAFSRIFWEFPSAFVTSILG